MIIIIQCFCAQLNFLMYLLPRHNDSRETKKMCINISTTPSPVYKKTASGVFSGFFACKRKHSFIHNFVNP
uniref:Uncharacterized protein n=1 Tax=Kuenenia stuttgartiensis TaxID=174633 RepID=Q1Q3Y7_KUEST|nr:unknown protein [Candidatus Kuenenia stuttgartiensis]